MKFRCEFGTAAGERRTVLVELEPEEIAEVKAADNPDLYGQAYALRHAYREIGGTEAGWRHIVGEITLLQ